MLLLAKIDYIFVFAQKVLLSSNFIIYTIPLSLVSNTENNLRQSATTDYKILEVTLTTGSLWDTLNDP